MDLLMDFYVFHAYIFKKDRFMISKTRMFKSKFIQKQEKSFKKIKNNSKMGQTKKRMFEQKIFFFV